MVQGAGEAPPRRRGARYALVVSIETDEVDTDIWTPFADQVGIAVPLPA